MWWKRILLGLVILVVGLYAAIYLFLHLYDLNRFKPRIANAVFDATGRRLTIAGDLEVDFGWLPLLAAENIAFENASWGSRQEMIRIERFQVRVALLPLVRGRLEIAAISLIGPDILLEKNADGDFNIPAGPNGSGNRITPAGFPLIHRVRVEDARLAFYDRPAGRQLELELDRASAELPDADSPLEIDLDGTFNRTPVAVFGTIGRPLPAFMSGRQLPATLAVAIANNRFQISGVVENTADFSGLDWRVTGAGRSIPDLVRLAGLGDLPDPGPFKFEVRFSGTPKHLTMSDLNLHLGAPNLVKVFLRGRIGDLLNLQDVDVQVIADGNDVKNVGQLLDTTIPWQGEFRAAGRLVRSAARGLRLDDAHLRIGDNDIAATVTCNLQHEKPRLSAAIRSRRFDLRPLFAADAFQPPNADAAAGQPAAAAGSRDGRQPHKPLLKRFDAELTLSTGTILLPQLVINELETTARLESGRLRIQTQGTRLPDLEELTGISFLPELGPIRLSCDLVETAEGLSMRNVDLQAGSARQTRLTVSGSIAELLVPQGFGLDIRIEGDDVAALGKYLLQPWPLRGRYAVSTRMVDPGKNIFAFDSIAGSLEEIDFSGSVKVDATGTDTRVAIAVSAPRFNLRPFVWPGLEIPETITRLEDVGPLDGSLALIVPAGNIGIADLQLQAGSADLLAVSLQGHVRDLQVLTGLDIALEAKGREVAELGRLLGKPIALQGAFKLRTRISDPKPGAYLFEPLLFSLADDQVTGFAGFDRSGKTMRVSADLSAPEIDLAAAVSNVEKPADPDAVWLDQVLEQQRVLPQWPLPPGLMQHLEADIRLRADRVTLAHLDIGGLTIAGKAEKDGIEFNADVRKVSYGHKSDETFGSFQMGNVNLTLKGRAAADRVAIDSIRLQGGSPETVSVFLRGTVTDTIRQSGINLTFDIHGQEVGHVWQLLDADFRASGPFSLSGSLTDPRPKQYRFEDLKAAVGESSVDGSVAIDYTGRRPRISARITTPYLDLRPYQSETADLGEMQPASPTEPGRSRKVFSDDPWSLEMLEKIELAVSLDAAQLYLQYLAAKDLRFELAVDAGILVLKPLQFSFGEGRLSGEITLRASGDVPTLETLVEISGYDVGRELEALGRAKDIQGILNGRIELKGPAVSTAEFMGGLSGQVVYTVTEGKINNRIIGVVYSDISDTLFNLLSPGRRRDPFIDLNCLVQSYDIKAGRAQNLGLLDTPQTTLITTGSVDLARERLDITLRSSSKGGVRIGGLGRIGISLSRFTRPFKLSGTLARPTLAVDPSQTALTIGTLLGGLALGPAGVAAILTDVSVGDKNPCLAAMEALGKGEKALVEEELGKSGDLIDRSADALVREGKKVIKESESTLDKSP